MSTTCPACKAELSHGVNHYCRGSQRVTREEFDALAASAAENARLLVAAHQEIDALEESVSALRDVIWDQLGESDAEKKGTVDARLEALERECSDLFGYEPPRAAITSALAAAENTNTGAATASGSESGCGDAGLVESRSAVSQVQPSPKLGEIVRASPACETRRHDTPTHNTAGTNPASTHPSPAPAFEMTRKQRDELWSVLMRWQYAFVRTDPNASRYCDAAVSEVEATITDLVRSELRKAREGSNRG